MLSSLVIHRIVLTEYKKKLFKRGSSFSRLKSNQDDEASSRWLLQASRDHVDLFEQISASDGHVARKPDCSRDDRMCPSRTWSSLGTRMITSGRHGSHLRRRPFERVAEPNEIQRNRSVCERTGCKSRSIRSIIMEPDFTRR